jgi:flagellar basal-body rod protein FlgG
MINSMQHLAAIGHNLANADTPSFKRELAVTRPFSAYLLETHNAGLQAGNSSITKVTDFSLGALRHTANPLDLAIEGDGYFVVETPQGRLYTRQGAFALDHSGHLVSAAGYPIVGEGGELRLTSDQPRIDKEGALWERGEMVGRLKIVRFSDSRQLERLGRGLYRSGSTQPLPQRDAQVGIRQGFIETSNVDAMSEMVDLITTMRQLEGSQKVIQGYNEMLNLAIQTIADI